VTLSDAIRSVLKAARKPIRDDVLVPAVERKLQQVVGRARIRRHISVMQCTTDRDIVAAGIGRKRTYALKGAK